MTILDKENVDNKKKKKSRKKQGNGIGYKILSFLMIVVTVLTIIYVIYENIFAFNIIIPVIIIALVVFVIAFILNQRKLRKWLKNIFSFFAIIIIIFDILMAFYGTSTLKFLSNLTDTGYRVDAFGVYVLKDSEYNKLSDLNNKKITYLNHDDDKNIRAAIASIGKKITITSDYEDEVTELLNKLVKGETDAIIMEESYEQIVSEEYETLFEKIKRIESLDIVNKVNVIKSDKDITKDPFVIYISGIDTNGSISKKARSDVNILLGVNPKTKEILLVNTPRDFYVTFHTRQKKDKLTHAGIFGVEESLKTLADLYDVEIDYYVRVNFTSFIGIVDALKGIKVNVPKSFCESDQYRNKHNKICLSKGSQILNGRQALALARHRKSIGDRVRGENQMLVVEAIINKAISPSIITSYKSIIDSLQGKVTTNMTTDEMYTFIKKQMKSTNDWKFTSMSANGKDSKNYCLATGSGKAYVMEPDMETVEKVKLAFDDLFAGKKIGESNAS